MSGFLTCMDSKHEMEKIISGFRTTGVYPINRAVVFIKTPVKSRMGNLEAKKIHYLPLYSPSLSRYTSPVHNTTFTTEEILCYVMRKAMI